MEEADSLAGRDVRAVVDAVRQQLPWNVRTNSRVPRSGLRYLH